MKAPRLLSVVALLIASCATVPIEEVGPALEETAEPLKAILESRPNLVKFLRRAEEQRTQIVLGFAEADTSGKRSLHQVGFRAGAEYFYPASSVKFLAAIAALEGLAEIRGESGLAVDRDTPMVFYPLFEGEVLEQEDSTHLAGGTITVGHEIRKLALVSDNEAFNKLYEFVGQDGLARSLARAGLTEPRIVHRLSEFRTPEENLRSPRIDFVGSYFRLPVAERTATPFPEPPPPLPKLLVGKGYISGDTKIDEPLDFSAKNRISLVDLQRGLCKLFSPEVDCGGGSAFRLAEDDRQFLLGAMSEYPPDSADPKFDLAEYPDGYAKNLLPGLLKVLPKERWRIVNKTGAAYGFSIENAWVEDRATGRGLFVSATIYTNSDGILNDDIYEYDDVAAPFFTELGRALGAYLAAPAQPKNR